MRVRSRIDALAVSALGLLALAAMAGGTIGSDTAATQLAGTAR